VRRLTWSSTWPLPSRLRRSPPAPIQIRLNCSGHMTRRAGPVAKSVLADARTRVQAECRDQSARRHRHRQPRRSATQGRLASRRHLFSKTVPDVSNAMLIVGRAILDPGDLGMS